MSTLTLAKRISLAGVTTLFALGTVNMISPAQAASLNLNYTVENLTDGWFNYSFNLKLTTQITATYLDRHGIGSSLVIN
jgi:hypothetical protein